MSALRLPPPRVTSNLVELEDPLSTGMVITADGSPLIAARDHLDHP